MNTEALVGEESARRLLPTLSLTAWASSIILVLVGSIVRVTGHGLGCPDWPLCYGRAIPPAYAGAWVEFSHRLVGGLVSLQVAAILVLVWRDSRREKWIFRPAIAASVVLVLQVLLGGLHVVMEIPPQTGLVHTATAMLLVGLLAVLVATSTARLPESSLHFLRSGRNPALVTWTAASTYLLLVTGSHVTRSGASLACLSIPLCGAVEQASRQLVEIHMLHRIVALLVAGPVAALVVRLRSEFTLRSYGYALGGLLVLQILLGMVNVLLLLPMWSRVLHITLGALIWSGLVFIWTLSRRSLWPEITTPEHPS